MNKATAPVMLTVAAIIHILGARKCICGQAKARAMSHCRGCYFALPPEKKTALYRRVGSGYEAAYMDSLEYLRSVRRLQGEFVFDGGEGEV